ncbi:MAG: F0F1 ATP synthase subunit A [Spirochaetaceae bacterium]|jgi:F-type H+-transporting ATPase subunit a|nr:F0F1 ATP synthase subunit A [Spirochaetaceae bacterium]
MNLGEELMKSLEIETVFTISIAGHKFPVTETVIVSWVAMALLIIAALLLTRNFRQIPRGVQTLLEGGIEFLNDFSKKQFGRYSKIFGPYIGTLFLFLLAANILPAITPIFAFGKAPVFEIKPPARDINVCAALALVSVLLMLFSGLIVRGPGGWLKKLLQPIPMMLPFNLLEYVIRPLSLCLRLFGNILGGFIIMTLINIALAGALKFSLVIPIPLSLYFDFFDGFIQALVFTFLTTLYVSEAVSME